MEYWALVKLDSEYSSKVIVLHLRKTMFNDLFQLHVMFKELILMIAPSSLMTKWSPSLKENVTSFSIIFPFASDFTSSFNNTDTLYAEEVQQFPKDNVAVPDPLKVVPTLPTGTNNDPLRPDNERINLKKIKYSTPLLSIEVF